MHSSLGLVSMLKRMFWHMFKAAWQESFTVANITLAFAKTGIWPYNPCTVVQTISRSPKAPPPVDLRALQTPVSCKAIRRIQRAYKKEPTKEALACIFHANVRLAAQHSVDSHVIQGLFQALQLEKKKRQRGKRLNLVGEEDNGPQFYSPARIQAARAFQAAKQATEEQQKLENKAKKAQATAVREQKQLEKEQRAVARQLAKEEKVAKAAENKLQKELQKQAKMTVATVKKPRVVVPKAKKPVTKSTGVPVAVAVVEAPGEWEDVEEAKLTSSRGRTLKLPVRYKK
jgi:hypothetical protein